MQITKKLSAKVRQLKQTAKDKRQMMAVALLFAVTHARQLKQTAKDRRFDEKELLFKGLLFAVTFM